MAGNPMVGQIIAILRNSGLKYMVKKILASANPEQMALGIMNAYVGKNPNLAPMWKQAQEMARSGNAREKAVNMFNERGINIDEVIDGIAKEVNS